MKELLEFIVKHLVDFPDDVRVNEIIGEETTIYELKVAESDIGIVIGKHGSHADAIRILLKAATKGTGKRIQLEILKPEG